MGKITTTRDIEKEKTVLKTGKCHDMPFCYGIADDTLYNAPPCPVPPDPASLNIVKEGAKTKARLDAVKRCLETGCPNCICAEGHFTEVESGAKLVRFENGREACRYYAIYIYLGLCKEIE